MPANHERVGTEAMPRPRRSIYVIGCPRSGTTFTSKVFRAAGIDVAHERQGADGVSDWREIVQEIPASAVVLHQVRHPLECITSMQTILKRSFNRLMGTNAIRGTTFSPDRRVEVCARAWLFYNVQCEAIADVSFRVESEAEWATACTRVGLPAIPRDGINPRTNSRRQVKQFRSFFEEPVTLDRIEREAGRRIREAIVRQACCYGYQL